MFNSTAEEQEAAARDVAMWAADNKLNACIDRVLPLSQAAEAHRLQEESTVKKTSQLAGKIILKP
jgi:NADPH2:quinone reductase